MQCRNCGNQNAADARFCSRCGEVISRQPREKSSGGLRWIIVIAVVLGAGAVLFFYLNTIAIEQRTAATQPSDPPRPLTTQEVKAEQERAYVAKLIAQKREQATHETIRVVQQLAVFNDHLAEADNPVHFDRRIAREEATFQDSRSKLNDSNIVQPLLATIAEALQLARDANAADVDYWNFHDGRKSFGPGTYDVEQQADAEQKRLFDKKMAAARKFEAKVQEFKDAYREIQSRSRANISE